MFKRVDVVMPGDTHRYDINTTPLAYLAGLIRTLVAQEDADSAAAFFEAADRAPIEDVEVDEDRITVHVLTC